MKTIIVYDGKVFEDLDAVLRESGVMQSPSLESLEMELAYAIVIRKNRVAQREWKPVTKRRLSPDTGEVYVDIDLTSPDLFRRVR